ncbi:ERF family protein [Clostridium beijerinckii]|uniref:ERF family protein n=1 Tax=Clostridium beijerinckii TaxID=1520 RepID=UPI00098BEF28|nr:ERF family protein [Clostridium beijerinckii]NRT76345.1 hypothetical protein [Clostridium beijerinckii]OOM48618.1 ERF superfamily protein [Clostridium beijerinckii]
MSEKVSLNIYKKLDEVRQELTKKKLTKSGKVFNSNGSLKYEYFQLEDFLPHVTILCHQKGITTKFRFTRDKAFLDIIDNDDPKSKIPFDFPVEISSVPELNEMQNLGGTRTQVKRYLYFDAFEISDADTIEGLGLDKAPLNEGDIKIDKAAITVIKKLIKETGINEAEFLEELNASKVEDIKNKNLAICMKKLRDKQKQIEKEKAEKKQNGIPEELSL